MFSEPASHYFSEVYGQLSQCIFGQLHKFCLFYLTTGTYPAMEKDLNVNETQQWWMITESFPW